MRAIYSILFILSFSSCIRNIELKDLKIEENWVVEGGIQSSTSNVSIKVTAVGGINQMDNFKHIDDLELQIEDTLGQVYPLTYNYGTLRYEASGVNAQVDVNYTLVLKDSSSNMEYKAEERLAPVVELQQIKYHKDDHYVYVTWNDPDSFINNYRLLFYRNGMLSNPFNYLTRDIRYNGKKKTFRFKKEEIVAGDSIDICLLSIDSLQHAYFRNMRQLKGRGLSLNSPYNPDNNFDNPFILGYFTVEAMSKKGIRIPN